MTEPCTRCDGDGWVPVHANYADHLAEQTTKPGTDAHAQLRDALARSVYPCKDCRPVQFFRWAEGHWSRDHDSSGCSDCSTHTRPGTTRKPKPTPEPLPREPPPPEPPPVPVQRELVPERGRKDLDL